MSVAVFLSDRHVFGSVSLTVISPLLSVTVMFVFICLTVMSLSLSV